MGVFLYATVVAVFLFNFGATIPVAQFSPTYTCPPAHYLFNNVCVKNPDNVHQIPAAVVPCSTASCQTAAVSQPCSTVACQTGQVVQPCSTASCQTTACSTTSCQTAISTTQQCSTATSCSNCQSSSTCQSTGIACCQQRSCQTDCCPTCCNSLPCKQPCNCPPIPLPPPTPPLPPSPPPTSPPSPPPPPPSPKPCLPGTILINGYCHLVYCGSGIYRDGKCIITVCPDGTVWTGSKCEAPVPQEYPTMNITNVIITNVNRTNDNHQMNYTNNITIHITESPETSTNTTSPPTNCCIIVTPIACTWTGYRHNCRSQRYRQCGLICTSKYIYLTPPKVQVIPPPTCIDNDCDNDLTPFYPDCSTCDNMIEERCVTYCQRNTCQRRQCQAVDLRGYCDSYQGSIGCRRMDGCTQDWCA